MKYLYAVSQVLIVIGLFLNICAFATYYSYSEDPSFILLFGAGFLHLSIGVFIQLLIGPKLKKIIDYAEK